MDAHFSRMFQPAERETKDQEVNIPRSPPNKKRKQGDSVDPQDIQKLLDEADRAQIENVDAGSLKSRLIMLEKRINKNQLLRAKYVDQPEKFMESEVALDEEISRLKEFVSDPSLFNDFVALNGIPTVLGLLSHENSDISVDVVALLADLTDPENLAGTDNTADVIVDALLKNDALELIVHNLSKMVEAREEDAKAVYDTMQILENLSELRPTVNLLLCEKTGILKFLVQRVKEKKYDENKLYCSEILSILLQSDSKIQKLFADGIDPLLQAISYYRRRDPTNPEEGELIENLFNSLCSALMIPSNQDLFRTLEGFELMLRCIKEKKYARECSLKVLNHAVCNNERNCERLIEIGGLKTLFPSFMGRTKSKQGKRAGKRDEDDEEHCVAIIGSLFLLCPRQSKYQVCERLLCKFLENDMEKVDRLLELYDKYQKKIESIPDDHNDVEDSDDEDDYRLQQRLGAGLFTMQRIALIMAYLSLLSDPIKTKILEKLHEQNRDPTSVKEILAEYAEMVGESGTEDKSITDTKDILHELAQVF